MWPGFARISEYFRYMCMKFTASTLLRLDLARGGEFLLFLVQYADFLNINDKVADHGGMLISMAYFCRRLAINLGFLSFSKQEKNSLVRAVVMLIDEPGRCTYILASSISSSLKDTLQWLQVDR